MQLKILLPSHILIDESVQKIVAEGLNGSFCLKPRHIDFVSALKPGIFQFINKFGKEVFVAMDEAILIKSADDVLVSAFNAFIGDDLATLKETVELRFRQLDENDRNARSALARLESGVVKHFIEM